MSAFPKRENPVYFRRKEMYSGSAFPENGKFEVTKTCFLEIPPLGLSNLFGTICLTVGRKEKPNGPTMYFSGER